MRVLVLGGTRFVGPFALRALIEAGHDMTIFHRGHTEPDLPESIRHVHGDFAAFGDHVDELRALVPEVVVDTVPYIDKAGHGVSHFVDVAERAVVLTSGDVYRAFARLLGSEPGPPDPVPLLEDSPLRTLRSPDRGAEIDYDNLEVERAVEALAMPVTVLRLAVVYGPGDPQRRLHGYVRRMDDRRPAILLEEPLALWRWSREHAANVGAAVSVVVGDGRSGGRVYNVAPERTLTEREWVEAIAQAAGWRGEILLVPTAELPETMRSGVDLGQELVMDASRMRRELGFSPPVALHEGLLRTIEWERGSARGSSEYTAEDAVLARSLGDGLCSPGAGGPQAS
jgi:nucleoside-diphosphate-sugar epimerase